MNIRCALSAVPLLIFIMGCNAYAEVGKGFPQDRGAVPFEYVDNTSLVVLPVTINGHGPYRFLLDTGASNTILSAPVADALKIPKGPDRIIITAGGNIPVTLRKLKSLEAGAARLENIDVAVGEFSLLKTMKVDGILGSEYLRRFKVSIDYDNKIVRIEPCCPDQMSRVV